MKAEQLREHAKQFRIFGAVYQHRFVLGPHARESEHNLLRLCVKDYTDLATSFADYLDELAAELEG